MRHNPPLPSDRRRNERSTIDHRDVSRPENEKM
jgi:hypothetical protein